MLEKEFCIDFFEYLKRNNIHIESAVADRIASDFIEQQKPELENLRMQLEVLPSRIMKEEHELLKITNEVGQHQLLIDSTESSTKFSVAEDKTLTNDMMRRAEVGKKLKENQVYNDSIKAVLKLKEESAVKIILIDFLKRAFKAAEAISYMGGHNE